MTTIAGATIVKRCKLALVEGIAALDTFASVAEPAKKVKVDWSHPIGAFERRHAWIGDFHGDQSWGPFGQRSRNTTDASYFELHIFVTEPGAEAQEVEEIALDLLADVEDWLRYDEKAGVDLSELPGCKRLEMSVGNFDLDAGTADKARAVLIHAQIKFIARH